MPRTARILMIIGALSLMTATQLSALGFHALDLEPAAKESWNWGNQLQFYQSLGLVLIGLLAARLGESRLLAAAGALIVVGLCLFSGSIYLQTTGLVPGAGAVAPMGGGSFMVAWLLVAIAVFRTAR
ncbi:MAG: DUF423 domain-containing protein [Chromatiales bacterium]|jgi:uncharacterized membrane protein YgdD (TMEM256/DUF423 family)|nr:DUF423 domain-containing protein [Chromatiales bacterium]